MRSSCVTTSFEEAKFSVIVIELIAGILQVLIPFELYLIESPIICHPKTLKPPNKEIYFNQRQN
jgi:hypothetical protein